MNWNDEANHILDGGGMVFDPIADLQEKWVSKIGNYAIVIDDENLTLYADEAVVCSKSYYYQDKNGKVNPEFPDFIYAKERDGFGEISHFVYGGGNRLKGLIVKNENVTEIEFVHSYAMGFMGMGMGMGMDINFGK